jgi:flagellar motor switch/type III secretory pathway protein FliN
MRESFKESMAAPLAESAKKLSTSGLKQKAQELLTILEENFFQSHRHLKSGSAILQALIQDESLFNAVSFIVSCECGRTMNEQKFRSVERR